MSSSSAIFRKAAGILPVAVVCLFLASCSFSPVYSDAASLPVPMAFAEPDNRMEQVVYQDLAAYFPVGAAAHKAAIKVSSSSARVGRTSSGSIFALYEAKLTASVIVSQIDDNAPLLFDDTFTSSATYDVSGQVLADRAALADAQTRAAHALAQTIRLALLGALGSKG